MRFLVEGEWTGYHSGQRRVVHRTVHDRAFDNKFHSWIKDVPAITYTDGTQLLLRVRDLELYERVTEIRGYDKLLRDCFKHNVTRVMDLPPS